MHVYIAIFNNNTTLFNRSMQEVFENEFSKLFGGHLIDWIELQTVDVFILHKSYYS